LATKEQFTVLENGWLVRAPAKINLTLLIAGKRPDGFHEIETLMAKIDFYDDLLFEPSRKNNIELICQGKHHVPSGPENLVHLACSKLFEAANVSPSVKVTLTKNIPAGAGLGGGSSDAAAALMGLNKFAKLNVNDQTIHDIAASLGSDIPFFLGGPLAFCTGRGEKIQKINKKFPFTALLITPNVSVATKRVYENYKHDNDLYESLNDKINKYIQKKTIDLAPKLCANMLESSCFEIQHDLARLKSQIDALKIGRVCLSGSGSAMFCMITNAGEDIACYQSMLKQSFGCESLIVNSNRW
jgi:4-diphosphocytidyl-2-C-methyl-D-erythritol kinase